jgi:hypothetical protein
MSGHKNHQGLENSYAFQAIKLAQDIARKVSYALSIIWSVARPASPISRPMSLMLASGAITENHKPVIMPVGGGPPRRLRQLVGFA